MAEFNWNLGDIGAGLQNAVDYAGAFLNPGGPGLGIAQTALTKAGQKAVGYDPGGAGRAVGTAFKQGVDFFSPSGPDSNYDFSGGSILTVKPPQGLDHLGEDIKVHVTGRHKKTGEPKTFTLDPSKAAFGPWKGRSQEFAGYVLENSDRAKQRNAKLGADIISGARTNEIVAQGNQDARLQVIREQGAGERNDANIKGQVTVAGINKETQLGVADRQMKSALGVAGIQSGDNRYNTDANVTIETGRTRVNEKNVDNNFIINSRYASVAENELERQKLKDRAEWQMMAFALIGKGLDGLVGMFGR